jgi:hypothetical protein
MSSAVRIADSADFAPPAVIGLNARMPAAVHVRFD